MTAERVCLSYREYFDVKCIRPATVCGVSPRMRFDVVVNMFVLQAFTKNKIIDHVATSKHIEKHLLHFVGTEYIGGNSLSALTAASGH